MKRVQLEANPAGFLFVYLYLSQPVQEVLAPGSSRIVVWVVYFAEVPGAGGGRMLCSPCTPARPTPARGGISPSGLVITATVYFIVAPGTPVRETEAPSLLGLGQQERPGAVLGESGHLLTHCGRHCLAPLSLCPLRKRSALPLRPNASLACQLPSPLGQDPVFSSPLAVAP